MEQIDFNIVEIRIIQSLWETKAPEYIANMLDRSYTEVGRKILEMNKVHNVKLFERPKFDRVLKSKEKEIAWAKRQLEEKEIKIKKNDSGQLISVRLDHKTVVMVKPGTDIEKLRNKLNSNKIK